jgi:hypothetical protein
MAGGVPGGYGGTAISNAAVGNERVKALVYAGAFHCGGR